MKVTQFQETIETIGRGLAPDRDWMPVLILEKGKDMMIIGMVLGMDEMMKEACCMVMSDLIAKSNPDAVCWIVTAWCGDTKKYEGMDIEELEEAYAKGYIPTATQDPDHTEAVVGTCIGVKGEADGEALMIGRVERSPDKPPRISKWDVYEDEARIEGRFADAIRFGFEHADPNGSLKAIQK